MKVKEQSENIQAWCITFPILNHSIIPCLVLTFWLTHIQDFQEAGKMVWYFHLFQNFPQFVVIHTVKGSGVINKAEVDVFLELSCFLYDPTDVGNLISGSSTFSKSSLNFWKFTVMYCWSLAWRILSITLLGCEMSAIVGQFQHSLALPFFGIGTKTDFFQSCGHCWVFQICWHIECPTFTASSLRIWNSSTGIPSPPLASIISMANRRRSNGNSDRLSFLRLQNHYRWWLQPWN